MLLYRFLPFNFARLKDKDYKLIADKNYNDFWKSKETQFRVIFPEKFKGLFQSMIAINPKERLTIEEILAHEWFEGQTSTIEEVKEYSAIRERLSANILEDRVLENKRKAKAEGKQKMLKKGKEDEEIEKLRKARK